jgi:O-antigen ligase
VPVLVHWLLAVGLFLAVSRFHQHFTILAKLQAPLVILGSALLLTLAHIPAWRPGDLRRHWIPLTIGLIVLIALVGAPVSIYRGRSASFILDVYSRTLLVALMVWAVARTTAGTRFVARAFAVAGTAACVLALALGRVDPEGRIDTGYTYDPNDLALVAIVTVPFMVWWALDRKSRHRWFALVGLAALLMVVVRSNSRGGFLGIAAVAVGFLLLAIFTGGGRLRRASLALAVLAVLSFPLLPASYRDRVRSIGNDDDYNLTSVSGRKQVWKRGMRYMWDHPLLGVGIDNFRTAEGRLSTESLERQAIGHGFKWSAAHNSFVQAGAELGVIGGLAFALLILKTPVDLIRHFRRSRRGVPVRDQDLLPPLLAVSFLGFAVSGFFLSFAYSEIPYILLAMASAVLLRGRPQAAPVRRGGLIR